MASILINGLALIYVAVGIITALAAYDVLLERLLNANPNDPLEGHEKFVTAVTAFAVGLIWPVSKPVVRWLCD